MQKRALITGLTGQDGSYLAEFLLAKDYEVYGLVRRVSTPNYTNIEHMLDKVNIVDGDLTDPISILYAIEKAKPDEVYNLAAQSFVATSFRQPIATSKINSEGEEYMIALTHFLSHANVIPATTKFYQASTSEMFGNSHTNGIQNEQTPFDPESPYARAKLNAFFTTKSYRKQGMFACNGILFNHESERRGREFVSRKITDGVAKIKLGLEKELRLGNLNAKRDWGHAEDSVEAIWLMMQHQTPDDYIIATGKSHSVREFAEKAFECAGIKDWEQYVKVDPRYFREADVQHLQGDPSKAMKILGWKPKVTFEQLVERMVKADIKRLKRK